MALESLRQHQGYPADRVTIMVAFAIHGRGSRVRCSSGLSPSLARGELDACDNAREFIADDRSRPKKRRQIMRDVRGAYEGPVGAGDRVNGPSER